MLAGLLAMMRRVQPVPVRYLGVMRGFFVIARLVVGRSLAVMFGCVFVMFSSLLMVFGAFVCHGFVS